MSSRVPRGRRDRDEGWASLVLTGVVVPLLLMLFLVLSLGGAVVYAWLRAGVAADAAAGAAGDPAAVARASLSSRLAGTAVVDLDDRGAVTVEVLALGTSMPGPWHGLRVRASSQGRFGR